MRYFLFDFDGTLVDSMPIFISNMLRILEENGISYEEDIVKIITPLGNAGIARYFRELGVKQTEKELLEQMDRNGIDAYERRVEAKETVVETLCRMKARGDHLNVLTASPHVLLDPCLKRLGVYDLFTNVWSCDDFDTTKADPRIYHMAAERIGMPVEKIVFVDDNLNADKTAKAAGMTVIGIFDESSAECEADIRAVTDGYVYLFEELLSL